MSTYIKRSILIYNIYCLSLKYIILLIIFILIILILFSSFFTKTNIFSDIEKYYAFYKNEKILLKRKYFNKVETPKISIISAIYNKENYLLRFIRNIQNQDFNDIEIILVDDCSNDNTINIIENMQKVDKRIILIKHHVNKGTLISRNDGILKSKGEYLIIPDSDDIFLNNLLERAYKIIKENDYDLLRFNAYEGENTIFMNKIVKHLTNYSIYQPELSYYIFYGKGKLKQTDYVLWNKIIKREAFILALNSINNYYLSQNMILYEDGLINYMLYKKAKSFYYFDYIGYYYFINEDSIMSNYKNKIEKIINNDFKFLLYIYKYTNNKIYEKKIASLVFLNMPELLIDENYKSINTNFEYYYSIIDLYLNSKYISSSIKNKFLRIQSIISNLQKKNNFYNNNIY
jgi:glycosyltransferase involved in cell wall biosynthesis